MRATIEEFTIDVHASNVRPAGVWYWSVSRAGDELTAGYAESEEQAEMAARSSVDAILLLRRTLRP